MIQMPVIILVDNRKPDSSPKSTTFSSFSSLKSSAFKATELDKEENSPIPQEFEIASDIQMRVDELELRVRALESKEKHRRYRRKISELQRSFQCPHPECARFYGSETSLKNHLKIKHSGKTPIEF